MRARLIEDDAVETINAVEYAKVRPREHPSLSGERRRLACAGSCRSAPGHALVSLVPAFLVRREGDTPAALDTVLWVEPIVLLNETPQAVQLDSIAYVHHPDDPVGGASGLDLMEARVLLAGGYIPVGGWSGVLPPYSSTKFESHLHYNWTAQPRSAAGILLHWAPGHFLPHRICRKPLNEGDCALSRLSSSSPPSSLTSTRPMACSMWQCHSLRSRKISC